MTIIKDGVLMRVEENDIVNGRYAIPKNVEVIQYFVLERKKLREIIIPDGVKEIETEAFEGNNLTSVAIPDSVAYIGGSAFARNQISKLSLPSGLKEIEYSTFSNNQLTEVTLPASLIEIEGNAFANNQLVNLTIPDNVVKIGYGAFARNKLETLILPDNIDNISRDAFGENPQLKIIYCRGHQIILDKPLQNIEAINGDILIICSENGLDESYIIVAKDGRLVVINDPEELEELDILISHNHIMIEKKPYFSIYEKFSRLRQKGLRSVSWTFLKLSLENIAQLDVQLMFNILKYTEIDDNIKGSLLEMMFVLGICDDKVVNEHDYDGIKNITRDKRRQFLLDLLINPPCCLTTDEYNFLEKIDKILMKKAYTFSNNQYQLNRLSTSDRKQLIILFKNYSNKMLNNTKAHQMFDGMNLDGPFNEYFYLFFVNNYNKIISSNQYMNTLASIQRNFATYFIRLGLNVEAITIEQIMELISKEPYKDVGFDFYNFAREAKACGVDQDAYTWYQNVAYIQMCSRKESSIPALKVILDNGMNGKIIRLDDINNLLAGHKTDCCQKYNGVGQTSMMHASFSNHGRLLLIRNKEGEIIGQSWVWFNNNTLCFDNFEASAEYKNSVNPHIKLRKKFERYKHSVKTIYLQIAKEAIRISNATVNQLAQKNPHISYDDCRILSVTLGKGYDDSGFLDDFPDIEEPVLPPMDLGFMPYSDAKSQVLIAGKVITNKTDYPSHLLFRDKREIKFYDENMIDEDVITGIRQIEKRGHKPSMWQLQKVFDIRSLKNQIGSDDAKVHIIMGEDYYYLYLERTDELEIVDLVRQTPRFSDEALTVTAEMYKIFKDILKKANGRPIKASLREDTSNILFLTLLKYHKIELIGDVTKYNDNTFGFTHLNKEEYLRLRGTIALHSSDQNATTNMYNVTFTSKQL